MHIFTLMSKALKTDFISLADMLPDLSLKVRSFSNCPY